MGTFDCRNSCDKFCKSSKTEALLFQLTDIKYGLTEAERALCAQQPTRMLKAYQLSWNAELLCLQEFPNSVTNDASDACRHFV